MKKKNYALVASFLMMLVATLTSCEKFALDETSTDPHDANANVTFHVSMGKTAMPSRWRKYAPDSHSASSTK